MSKAVEGAAMLAGAAATGAVMFAMANSGVGFAAMPWLSHLMEGLVAGGISMEAGAIANALTSNRGQNITTRQAASYRQVIYGEQRVGGVTIYRSTTGSHKNQYNFVIVLAGHVIDSIGALYLDGRQVFFNSGVGTTTRNGVTFGGSANSSTYSGPNGVQYNFGGLVYCEACYGDQINAPNTTPNGGYNTGLHANDPTWGPASNGDIPYVGGCAYVYLKLESNANMFPGEPEIRFTVRGKNDIYDPRTGQSGYSCNWALVCADVIRDQQFGLGDLSVNTGQLIAAANVCDEQVALVNGSTEARYACHYHYDTSTAPGDALQAMMPGAAGRVSRIGGEWYLWPAYWQGPSYSFNDSNLTGVVEWKPYRSYRDLFNRVTGTYTAPNYPYNVAGNLYDSNGFYNGQRQDNFAFAFQPTNYPQYACDVLHGYAADEYLLADTPHSGAWVSLAPYNQGDVVTYNGQFYQSLLIDGGSDITPDVNVAFWRKYMGKALPKEIALNCVLSVSQAQRVAKIYLLRNRQQGSGTFKLNLECWQMQPCDTFMFTYQKNGWNEKILEVDTVKFEITEGNEDQPPSVRAEFGVIETEASVYAWHTGEELSVYSVADIPAQTNYTPLPPTNMVVTSSSATAFTALDGTVTPRTEIAWDTPYDTLTRQIQVQYKLSTDTVWIQAGSCDVSLNSFYVNNVIAGSSYDFRIRSVRANGAYSDWVEVDGNTAGIVLTSQTNYGVGVGSLIGEAFSDGTAAIVCNTFIVQIGNYSVTVLPSSTTISGLTQASLYYVYYVDPTGAGGQVTPIATQNKADFLGLLGYWLIDSIITPSATSKTGGGGGGSSRYSPIASQDNGSRTTSSPAAAYDGDSSTCAVVSGNYHQEPDSTGNPGL